MDARSTRRLAVCSGAVVATLGAGLLIVPMAHADGVLPVTVPGTGGGVTLPSAGVGVTPSGSASALGTTAPVPSASVSIGVPTGAPSTSAPAPSTTASVPAGSAAPDPAGGVTAPVIDTTGVGTGVTTPTGIASVGATGSGGVTVVIGQQPGGGSAATVQVGGESGVAAAKGDVVPIPIDDVTPPAAPAVADPAASPAAPATTAGGLIDAAAGATRLLSLDVTPSIGTVYPVRDGYRDSVVFRLGAVTSDDAVASLTGTAVLRRAGREVARWRFVRSDEGLRWDGRDHGKVRAGVYALTVSAKDALGSVFQDKAKVTVSPKRLVARTRGVTTTASSGLRQMYSPAREALSRGPVTVVVRTVASRVKGKQYLVFTNGGKRFALRIRNGVHDSREITVPASFGSFRLSHTWKAGTVKLKKVRYLYTYQALK